MKLSSMLIKFFSLCLISTFATIVNATRTPYGAFVSSIEVFDTLSGTNNCTDPNQWFIINTELFIPAGSNEPISLSIPKSFGNLPNGSFPLKSKNNIVGSITSNDSNNFTIAFQKSIPGNITTTFNFLTKLISSAQKKISSPQTLSYVFNVSTGDSFNSAINFIPKDINRLSSNGGIYAENNTAWFIADIPISSLNQASRFSSKPAVASSYKFNTSLTTYEIVVKVDDLNRPASTVPFTALNDQSDSSQISLYINTNIDGGKYLRIKYYSEELLTTAIGTTVSLRATNSENTRFSKRDDDSQTLTTNYYSGNETNIEDINGTNSQNVAAGQITPLYSNSSTSNNETYETYSLIARTDAAIVTQIGTWIPITTLGASLVSTSETVTSSLLTNNTATSVMPSATYVQSTLNSTTTAQEASASLLSTASSSVISNATSSPPSITSASLFSTSNIDANSRDNSYPESYESYSIITVTKDGQLTSFTSWFAISTASSSYSSKSVPQKTSSITQSSAAKETASQGFSATVNESYETYSLITLTRDGEETVSTSWFPISTVSHAGNKTSTSTSSSTITKSTPDDSYETYSLVTLTRDGEETVSTSWFPISTVSHAGNKTSTSTSSSTITKSTSDDSYETYSLVTLTRDGEETVSTSWFPISTVSHAGNKTSTSTSSSTITKSTSDDSYETYSLVTLTRDGEETVSTNWFPISTVSCPDNEASTSSITIKDSPQAITTEALSTQSEEYAYETYSLTTKSENGEATLSTNWYPISTEYSSTRTNFASSQRGDDGIALKSQVTSISSTIQTLYTSTPSIEHQLSTSVSSNSSSFPDVTIYEGEARRTSIKLGGVFSGILLIALQLLR